MSQVPNKQTENVGSEAPDLIGCKRFFDDIARSVIESTSSDINTLIKIEEQAPPSLSSRSKDQEGNELNPSDEKYDMEKKIKDMEKKIQYLCEKLEAIQHGEKQNKRVKMLSLSASSTSSTSVINRKEHHSENEELKFGQELYEKSASDTETVLSNEINHKSDVSISKHIGNLKPTRLKGELKNYESSVSFFMNNHSARGCWNAIRKVLEGTYETPSENWNSESSLTLQKICEKMFDAFKQLDEFEFEAQIRKLIVLLIPVFKQSEVRGILFDESHICNGLAELVYADIECIIEKLASLANISLNCSLPIIKNLGRIFQVLIIELNESALNILRANWFNPHYSKLQKLPKNVRERVQQIKNSPIERIEFLRRYTFKNMHREENKYFSEVLDKLIRGTIPLNTKIHELINVDAMEHTGYGHRVDLYYRLVTQNFFSKNNKRSLQTNEERKNAKNYKGTKSRVENKDTRSRHDDDNSDNNHSHNHTKDSKKTKHDQSNDKPKEKLMSIRIATKNSVNLNIESANGHLEDDVSKIEFGFSSGSSIHAINPKYQYALVDVIPKQISIGVAAQSDQSESVGNSKNQSTYCGKMKVYCSAIGEEIVLNDVYVVPNLAMNIICVSRLLETNGFSGIVTSSKSSYVLDRKGRICMHTNSKDGSYFCMFEFDKERGMFKTMSLHDEKPLKLKSLLDNIRNHTLKDSISDSSCDKSVSMRRLGHISEEKSLSVTCTNGLSSIVTQSTIASSSPRSSSPHAQTIVDVNHGDDSMVCATDRSKISQDVDNLDIKNHNVNNTNILSDDSDMDIIFKHAELKNRILAIHSRFGHTDKEHLAHIIKTNPNLARELNVSLQMLNRYWAEIDCHSCRMASICPSYEDYHC